MSYLTVQNCQPCKYCPLAELLFFLLFSHSLSTGMSPPFAPLWKVCLKWTIVSILWNIYKLVTILSGGRLTVLILHVAARTISSISLRVSISSFQLAPGLIWSHALRTSFLHRSSPCECRYHVSISVSLLFGTRKYAPSMWKLVTSFNSVSSIEIDRNLCGFVGCWNNPAWNI